MIAGSRPLIAGFLWDDGNRAKCEKHGVSIADIECAMRGPIASREPNADPTDIGALYAQ